MDKASSECPYPGCFFCVMREGNPSKRRASVLKFFRELPSQDDDGQVLPISGLWNTAMAHPNDPEFIELGIFECMASLIWKGLKNRRWLSHDQNIYIPYYAAHIIGSYTMNMEEFADSAVHAGVIAPLVELLRGRLTWVEQRVAVRALGHLATYASTFPAVASHDEILELSIQLAMSSLEIVYSHFYQYVDRRLSYHCDLLTRGMGGVEMESRKAEEWASQLQCWSLQLINCFAFKPEFLPTICKPEFLVKLPGMWGGLVNENSPAGVGLLRTICHQKLGRGSVAACPVIIEALCNIARSSDDWQYMAIDCLLWLLQDSNTCHKVIDKVVPALVDLVEITTLGDHKKLGDSILNVLQDCIQSQGSGKTSICSRTKEQIEDLLNSKQRFKWEKNMPKEDLHIKQAAALVVKLEGNSLFSSGNISGAASKYSEALALCPMRSKKERVVLYSNRAQCYLLLQQPLAAISDATRALCLHRPVNRHAKSLWRRAQAYDMLGLAKESLLDAILFINECSQSNDPDLSLRQNKVPDYAERLVKKQMRAAWLFREAAIKHGGVHNEGDDGNIYGPQTDDSEWETASESDIGNDGRDDMGDVDDWNNDDERKDYDKPSLKGNIVTSQATLWIDDCPHRPTRVFSACFVLTRTLPGKTSQEPTGGQSNILFGDESVKKTSKKIHDQKFAELTGNNIFKEDVPPGSAEKPMSRAKLREITGSDIFADGKAENRDSILRAHKLLGGVSDIFDDGKAENRYSISGARRPRGGGSDIVADGKAENKDSILGAHRPPNGGSDIFADGKAENRDILGARRPPGRSSSITLG